MNRIVALTTVASALALATGCTPIIGGALAIDALTPDSPDFDDDWSDDSWQQESTAEGFMRGDLPEAGSFDADFSTANVWKSDGWIDFDLHVNDGSWAMIGGGFDTQELQDGETVVFEEGDHWVFGCGGEDDWFAEYDAPAETVEVTRTDITIDGVDMIELTIIADFGIGGSDGEVEAVVVQPVENNDD